MVKIYNKQEKKTQFKHNLIQAHNQTAVDFLIMLFSSSLLFPVSDCGAILSTESEVSLSQTQFGLDLFIRGRCSDFNITCAGQFSCPEHVSGSFFNHT